MVGRLLRGLPNIRWVKDVSLEVSEKYSSYLANRNLVYRYSYLSLYILNFIQSFEELKGVKNIIKDGI